MNRYHWFVFFVASAAWCFDCLDQQLFILARDNAVKALSPGADSLRLKELGGIALNDPSQGLKVQVWTLTANGANVLLSAPTVIFMRSP